VRSWLWSFAVELMKNPASLSELVRSEWVGCEEMRDDHERHRA